MAAEDKWMISELNVQLYQAYCRIQEQNKELAELRATIEELGGSVGRGEEVRLEKTTD